MSEDSKNWSSHFVDLIYWLYDNYARPYPKIAEVVCIVLSMLVVHIGFIYLGKTSEARHKRTVEAAIPTTSITEQKAPCEASASGNGNVVTVTDCNVDQKSNKESK